MDAGGQPITGDDAHTDPRWDYPEYPPGSVVELRVHGVGGEPPSGMTRDPHPRLVGGDELAGLWRARNPLVGALSRGRHHVREVLAWGGQTSGTVRHAFWVLLLPYALFNMAGRMHRSDPDSRWSVAHRAVARVLAYTMTLSFVALVAGIFVDLVGVQCAGTTCLERTADLTGGALLAPVRRYAEDHLARLGLLSLGPVVAVLLLWWAGRYRTQDLEGAGDEPERTHQAGQSPALRLPGEATRLTDRDFWRNAWPTSRLRATHASGAFAVIGVVVSLVHLDLAPTPHHGLWRTALWVSLAVVVGAGVVAALPRTVTPGPDPGLHQVQWLLRLGAVVPGTAGIALALVPDRGWPRGLWVPGVATALWWAVRSARGGSEGRPDVGVLGNLWLVVGVVLVAGGFQQSILSLDHVLEPAIGQLPVGLGTTFAEGPVGTWLVDAAPGLYLPAHLLLAPVAVLQIVLLAGLLLTGFERRPHRRADASPLVRPAIVGNLGAVTVGLMSLLVLMATTGSAHALVLDWLGERGRDLVLPWWHALTALVTAVWFPGALIVLSASYGIAAAVVPGFMVRPSPADVAAELRRGLDGEAVPDPTDPSTTMGSSPVAKRLGTIGRAWLTQMWLRHAGHLLSGAVAATTAIVAFFLVRQFLVDAGPGSFNDFPLVTAALWLTATGGLGAIALIRAGLSERATRRNIGRIWDVITVWPRVTHPFAPPCYGEAIVPMLADRLRDLTTHEREYRVVLAGHSQGSVVSLAAIGATQDIPPDRVALVSYGSPIALLYERFYPGVVGGPLGPVATATERVGTWHHLYGLTEPFAGPFWHEDGFDDVASSRARAGWGLSLEVPHADAPCPVCGWYRGGRADVTDGPRTTDHVVTDPDRWLQPLDPQVPHHRGHSTYHDHRELEQHLAVVADRLTD